MKKIRWGIIGCGDVTEIKSGPAFNKVKNSELIAVMRRNGEKAKIMPFGIMCEMARMPRNLFMILM